MAKRITKSKLGYCKCGEPLDFYGSTEAKRVGILGVCPQCNKEILIVGTNWIWGIIINKLTRIERIFLRGKHD